MVWPHGKEELNEFLVFLNTVHESIKFTMDLEQSTGVCHSWMVSFFRGWVVHLRRRVYWKLTHIDLYLNSKSSPFILEECGAVHPRIRAYTNLDPYSLPGELEHLWRTFLKNGYRRTGGKLQRSWNLRAQLSFFTTVQCLGWWEDCWGKQVFELYTSRPLWLVRWLDPLRMA